MVVPPVILYLSTDFTLMGGNLSYEQSSQVLLLERTNILLQFLQQVELFLFAYYEIF